MPVTFIKNLYRAVGCPSRKRIGQRIAVRCTDSRSPFGVLLSHYPKGKAERILFTIQQDFEAGLRLPGQGVNSLQELNAKFSLWLQSVYHVRVHSGTGMTPSERYQRGAHRVKALDPHLDLDQLFYHQLNRRVRRDGTVRLGNQLYEVDLSLRTLEVQLRFDPFKLDRIEVSYRGAAFGLAKVVNAQLNSQIQGANVYEKRA